MTAIHCVHCVEVLNVPWVPALHVAHAAVAVSAVAFVAELATSVAGEPAADFRGVPAREIAGQVAAGYHATAPQAADVVPVAARPAVPCVA